mmetsp:Transcript_25244/g.42069  ORF Transcript_25244/g.42069 Transcript_25244/m.42069 type:complete len:214 (-) Transcript_25244:263-904(-)
MSNIGDALDIAPETMPLLYFFCGNNLRRLDEMVRAMRQADFEAFSNLCSFDASWNNRATKTREKFAPLLEQLQDSIIENNEHWIKEVLGQPNKLTSTNWMETLKPIDKACIDRILTSLRRKGHSYSIIDLNLLVDRGFLSAPSELSELTLPTGAQMLDMYPYYKLRKQRTRLWGIPYYLNTRIILSIKGEVDNALNASIKTAVREGIRILMNS